MPLCKKIYHKSDMNHSTVLGSWWEKKRLSPWSSASMAAISWADGSCDIAILPFAYAGSGGPGEVCLRENLYVCVPPDHELARHRELTFETIDGFNFLLRTELGFWDTLCRQKMPASRFLVQTDEFAFDELVNSSSLPCFTTDYFKDQQARCPGRVQVPLTDPEAHVTFYMLRRGDKRINNKE